MAVYYVLLIGLTALGIPLCKKWNLSGGFSERRIANSTEKQSKTLVKIYIFIVFSALFLVAALRETSGYDYNLYANWYVQIYYRDYDYLMGWSREKGFLIPVKILTLLTTHWHPMFVVIALIIAAGIAVYIYKFSSCAYISVAAFICIGLYYNSLNFMRQFIAAIIISFALNYIDTKQPMRFLVLVLFASCFHFSALIMIPFYFLLRIRPNWIVFGVFAAASAVSYIYSIPILLFFTKYIYSAYDPLNNYHRINGLSARYAIIFGTLFILIFLFRKALMRKRSLNKILINMYFYAIYFSVIGIKHSVVSRFALLFIIAPVIVLTPDLIQVIIEKIKKKCGKETLGDESRGRIFSALVITAFCIYGLTVNTILLINNYNGVVPYQLILK